MHKSQLALTCTLALFSLTAFLSLARTAGAATQTIPSPASLADAVIYDGSLGTLPADQGMVYWAADTSPLFDSVEVVQSYAGNGARLDTMIDYEDAAGYSNISEPLDRQQGVTLLFTVQITSEDHTTSGTADKNDDGLADRAGFSVIALSSDGQWGIELGFWEDEIWAQNGGVAPTLFTHAKGVAVDTTRLTTYALTLLGDQYTLAIGDNIVLSGALRDYTGFSGFVDPYETANFLFFGDDTSSASAEIKLTSILVAGNNSGASFQALLPVVVRAG